MNTEVKNALSLLREAQKRVDEIRQKSDLTNRERNKIQSLYAVMLDLDDQLVLQEIKDSLEQLKQSSKRIKALSDQIKDKIEGFKDTAEAIEKASKAISTLADIVAKAISAGLI